VPEQRPNGVQLDCHLRETNRHGLVLDEHPSALNVLLNKVRSVLE
jgi:hypothetical protein